MSNVRTLSDATFAEFIQSAPVVVVDFMADWCRGCKLLSPVLDELSDRYTIGKLNVDENPSTPAQYGVMSLPTLIVFRDGEPVKSIVGYKSKAELERELTDLD
jgi:thioredoxin 1